MAEREVHVTNTRRPSLSSTQLKYLANGVLKALRRGPTRVTQGETRRFEVLGSAAIPNGPPPLEHARWYLARLEPHDGLGLGEAGILLSMDTINEAKTACTIREWHDLQRVTHNTGIRVLYHVSFHPKSGWFAQRNPEAGLAPGAAMTILEHAQIANHIMIGDADA